MKRSAILFVIGCLSAGLVAADPIFPYVLGSPISGDLEQVESEIRAALAREGFELVGRYSPYEGARVIVVTHPEHVSLASRSEMGGFGVALRIGVTDNAGSIEVSYTNPYWLANICRLEGDPTPVANALEAALGHEATFGSKKGKEPKKLRTYHYMAFMPHFNDPVELASHASHEDALAAVEAGLAEGRAGASKVYRVDIPGKDEVVFGVALSIGEGADLAVMTVTDTNDPKHTAHLPYELLVSGSDVYTLHGKFRIAQSFPDLGMGTFMKISGAPKAIHKTLGAVAQ